jgi:DNA polymerase I-like protein with 3'-5' exonuclease and polymerase domains
VTTTTSANGTPPFPKTARDAAALYLAKGLAPIPLPIQSKDPGYSGWQHLRLTPDTLDDRFPPDQARNVGILNGAPSGNALDVDLDCPQARLAAPLLLPATGWIFGHKSSPGSHWIYRADVSLAKAQEKYTDLDGAVLVELRGTGGLTVYPPSTHKDTGERITWETFADPADVRLLELQQAVRDVAVVSLLARHWPAKGTRQDAYLALAGGLLRAGWAQERVERFVGALAVATRDEEPTKRVQVVALTADKLGQGSKTTGWPKLEALLGEDGSAVVQRARTWLGLARDVESAGTASTKKRLRLLPTYTPFPLHCLPPVVSDVVKASAEAIGCDPALVACPALAVLAGCVGNSRSVRVKGGWFEPCVLWSLTVADSGGHKSPAYRAAVGSLLELQTDLYDRHREHMEVYKQALQDWQQAPKDERGAKPEAPDEPPCFVTSDSTIEALGESLEGNPHGLLLARDELDGWFQSFTRYKGGGTDRPQWLELHTAGTLLIHRKTTERRRISVRRAAVSITGTVQPAVLAKALDQEALQAGLGARFLLTMPPRRRRFWNDNELPEELLDRYQQLLRTLLELPLQDRQKRLPYALQMSSGARNLFVDFYNEWAGVQFAAEGEQAAAFAKIEAYAPRLMLLHHVVSHAAAGADDIGPITEASARAGIELARWFAAETLRVYAMLRESQEERDFRRLVEFIQARGGTISVRGLMRANCRRYPDADAAETALAALVESGLARWVPTKQGNPRAVELCMTHDTHDSSEDDDDDDGPDAHDNPPDTNPDAGPGPQPLRPGASDCEGVREGDTDADNPVMRVMRHAPEPGTDRKDGADAEPRHALETVSCARATQPPYLEVNTGAGLQTVIQALDESVLVGLDLETTGLDPRRDRARLLSLATERGRFLIDLFAVNLQALGPVLDRLHANEVVAHNGLFDLQFLAALGFVPGVVHDTMLLSQLLHGTRQPKGFHRLGQVALREIGVTLDKSHQRGDWSGPLSPAQLEYAASDAAVLIPLHHALARQIREAHLDEVALIEETCLPALAWLSRFGVPFDRPAWETLAREASHEAEALARQLDEAAPPRPGCLPGTVPWNWSSPKQVQTAFALIGITLEATNDDALAGVDHPLAVLLRQYRSTAKRAGTYGAGWPKDAYHEGRLFPGWKQVGADSGRMACSEPNAQNLPRDVRYRRCFKAPEGRVLVKADYSQIELRIAAKVSGDKALLDAYQRGDDLHVLTARTVLGVEDVTRQHRQLAKALNFGLLYGMGAKGFRLYAKSQYDLDITLGQAEQYRRAFFAAYPGLAAWHRRVGRSGQRTVETRTRAGRRRLNVKRFMEKLNSPVQGTGADGLKRALALLWERREQVPGAFPVLAVHDEIVVEADAGQADAVAKWLKTAMVEAMAPLIAPVPVEVEVKVARTWGGDEVDSPSA